LSPREPGYRLGPAPADQAGRNRNDAGFIAVEWLVAVVFLLLPVVLIGAGVSRWPERQQVARAAAAEAARAAVLSDTEAEALANAQVMAAEVATNYGVPEGAYTVAVNAPVWDRGQPVTVTVTMEMPAIDVPGVGSWSASDWSASSTQRIEDYRGLQ
jgi:Flp pilus assembly protein TadG